MCKTKYFIDRMNYVSRCEPVYSKKSDILPNNYKLASLRPDSGVYTLSHKISLCAVIF